MIAGKNRPNGKVVIILAPRRLPLRSVEDIYDPSRRTYKRAILTISVSLGKLFRMLPCVISPKVTKPAKAIVRQAIIDVRVE